MHQPRKRYNNAHRKQRQDNFYLTHQHPAFSHMRSNTPIKTKIRNLDLECVKPERAGVVLYTVNNGVVYFGWGMDSKSHDITDFGGRVVYETDKNVIQGALREFTEETLEIFEPLTIEEIQDCPVVYNGKNLIIFIHVKLDPNEVSRVFNKKFIDIISANPEAEPEVCAIAWLTWGDFQRSISNNGAMFYRVRHFLNHVGDFSYLL